MRKGNNKIAFDTLKLLTKSSHSKTLVIENKDGVLITAEKEVLNRWTEYCSGLCNYELKSNLVFLNNTTNSNRQHVVGDAPILQEEVEEAIRTLNNGKSPGIDNVPAELQQHGGQHVVKTLTALCNEIWEKLQELTTRLEKSSARIGMEESAEKSKILINNHSVLPVTNIKLNDQRLEEVSSFKYLGGIISKSAEELKTRIAKATLAMTKLTVIWRSNQINPKAKINLYTSLVRSILLYGCQSWTSTVDTERRIRAFETKSYRKILRITYRERKTNEFVKTKIDELAAKQESLLSIVKRRKMNWFGHITRRNPLAKTILQGAVENARRCGRPRKSWMENVTQLT